MAGFINIDDYRAKVNDTRLQQLIEGDDNVRLDIEASAIAVVTDYLSGRFDTDAIFAANDDDRSKNVIRWVVNIIIYDLFGRIPDRMVPDRVKSNYTETIANLQMISKGELSVVLPRKKNDDESEKTKFRWASNPKHSH